MKTKLIFLAALLAACFIYLTPAHAALVGNATLANPTEDGYVDHDTDKPATYTRFNAAATIDVHENLGTNDYKRGYAEFPVASIPNNATIIKVWARFRCTASGGAVVHAVTAHQPSAATDAQLWADINSGAIYVASAAYVNGNTYTVDLGATAITDLQTAIGGVDWFAYGWTGDPENHPKFSSEEGVEPPALIVRYTYKGVTYTFQGKWENNTNHYPVSFTVISTDGTSDLRMKAAATYGFTSRPVAVEWTTAGSDARYIYFVADTGTITLYEPTVATYFYEFTIKDYASKLIGTCYLEAYTGSTINQRMPIVAGNPIPFDFGINRTYDIQVLFGDGTRYNWGYYLAGPTLNANIILRGVTFDKQAYTASQFITVEATRSGGTVTVDYLDLQNGTTWANVTVRIRNGAVVATHNSALDSFTFNYAGAAGTSYVVSIAGENTYLPAWGYTKILDATETFPSLPSLTGIYTFGALSLTNVIGLGMSVFGFSIFSVAFKRQGLLLGWALTALLTYVGATGLSGELLAFIGFIAVIVAATGGQEGG